MRTDGRSKNEMRSLLITPGVSEHAEGSAIICFGKTKVLCTASFESQTPKWLQNTGKGWVTAEYGMLPRSTHDRIKRDKAMTSGRTLEISRLLGRSLRAAVDLKMLEEKQIIVDCDVIDADGGTRTAAITGGFVALALACQKIVAKGLIKNNPLRNYVSAVSVGIKNGSALLDLNYDEDSSCDVDSNFVFLGNGQMVEVQGTAEKGSFSQSELLNMLEVAHQGCGQLFKLQEDIIGGFFPKENVMAVQYQKTEPIWFATSNRNKIAEFKLLLDNYKDSEGRLPFELKSLLDIPVYTPPLETGKTFAENAMIKIKAASAMVKGWVIAEDSGLVVEGLGGYPGIYSARYAGDHATDAENVAKLLKMMAMRCPAQRKAHFICVAGLISPTKETQIFEGKLEGQINRGPSGKFGFGYDPVFVPDGQTQTLAEVPPGFKIRNSHRSRALRQIIELFTEVRPSI